MHALAEHVHRLTPFGLRGRVTKVIGLTVAVAGFPAPLGAMCRIEREHGIAIDGEVVGFRDEETLVVPLAELSGIRRGAPVNLLRSVPYAAAGDSLLGRVIDARGRFIDGKPSVPVADRVPLDPPPTPPLDRPRINAPLETGIRVLDGMLSCGKGQRLGIFAGSGVGKSTLLGQMAKNTSADVNVVVLVGERGREVREFLEKDLGPEGLAKSVVVVATGDEPAVLRLRAAHLGTAIAERFRDTGRDVLLMMDSVTRYALAQREIGLAAGEPPATRGYPPSVFARLPRLLERSGRTALGSITGFYTVLVEGDDTNEPISDTVRGVLDGHVVLSRKLAHKGHWPAVDVLSSVSRSMNDIVSNEHLQASQRLKRLLAAYAQAEDLIAVGAYQPGTDADVDHAVRLRPQIDAFLQQSTRESTPWDQTVLALTRISRLTEPVTRVPASGNSNDG